MASKTLNPDMLISQALKSLAKKNKAESYGAWLTSKAKDPKIKASEDMVKSSTAFAVNEKNAKRSSATRGGGYEKYLSDLNKSQYLSSMNAANDEVERKTQSTIEGYQTYVEGLQKQRDEQVDRTYKSLMTLGITDVSEAYRRALNAGLSSSDAKLVAKESTSATRTDLFRKAVNNIISRYFTSNQAITYAEAIGLPEDDARELGKIANIINQLHSKPNYYSSDYAEYLESLRKTVK